MTINVCVTGYSTEGPGSKGQAEQNLIKMWGFYQKINGNFGMPGVTVLSGKD